MNDVIIPCPACGADEGFTVEVILIQSYSEVYDADGVHVETNANTYGTRQSKNAVRCMECRTIRRDLVWRDGRIRVK